MLTYDFIQAGNSSVWLAMEQKHEAAVEVLLQAIMAAGVDIDARYEGDARDKRGQTLLMRASALGLTSAAAALLALGADFVAKYGPLADALSVVEPARTYGVAAALAFAVDENFRCAAALALLRALERGGADVPPAHRADALAQIGELMLQAHAAYTSIGLGAPQTDAIVRALAAAGPAAGIYGARVSGGGSGGTVVVLCERAALPRIQAMAETITFDDVPFTKLIE